jgi:nucleotide-binding universal stress UspA family protein
VYDKILVGYLDTEQGRDALELGRVLAEANHAEMLVVTASGSGEDGGDLAELARSEAADLVVLGSTHRGPLGRVVPGAMAGRLLGEATCAVAVAPPGFGASAEGYDGWRPLSGDGDDPGLRVIGVGFDGSHAAREALEAAVELALHNGAALRVYTVARNYTRPPAAGAGGQMPGLPSEAQALRDLLHDAVAGLPTEARALPVFLRGNPATELIGATEAGVDLLVLGSRPGGPLRRTLHSSISNAVTSEAICPVLICPAGVRARHPTPA